MRCRPVLMTVAPRLTKRLKRNRILLILSHFGVCVNPARTGRDVCHRTPLYLPALQHPNEHICSACNRGQVYCSKACIREGLQERCHASQRRY